MDTQKTEQNLVTIPRRRLNEFTTRLGKLGKKARKLGVVEPTFSLKAERTVTETLEGGREINVQVLDLELHSEPIKFADWTLLAVIDPIGSQGDFVLKVVPGMDTEAGAISKDLDALHCDHCKARRRRKETFIVRHLDGSLKQVGRQCLRDFLGHITPEHIAAMLAFLHEIVRLSDDSDEGWGGGFLHDPLTDLVSVLEVTAAIVRRHGWVPRSQATFNTPTAEFVTTFLIGRGDMADRLRREAPVEQVDQERAAEVIAWVRGMEEDKTSTTANAFIENLRTIFKFDEIESRFFGFACSAISAFMKHLDRQGEILRKKDLHKNSQHVGTVGTRQVFTGLTVESIRSFEGQWGVTTLIKFIDQDGNLLVWFASGDKVDDFRIGATVDLKATVKKHDDFREVAQTALNRCQILKQEGGEENETND